jgi:hypothetical protein
MIDAAPTSTIVSVQTTKRFGAAALLPSGRVIVSSEGAMLLWDPRSTAPPRKVDLAPRSELDYGPLLRSGGTRFVVTRQNEAELVLDLWDAEELTKVKTLDGSWKASAQSLMAFSPDGNRFLYAGCTSPPNRTEIGDCEVSVYRLPDGEIVHRTKLPSLRFVQYLPSFVLSPSGKYFALSHELFASQAYDSETGKLVYRVPSPGESYLDGSGHHFLFLDDRRLLTSVAFGSKLDTIDLEAGRRTGGADLKLGKEDFASEQTLSPDRKRMAMLIRRGKRAPGQLVLWNIDTDAVATHDLPQAVCPDYCELHFVSAREIVVHSRELAPEIEWRLDVEAGTAKNEIYEAIPVFAAGPFRVFGDVSASHYGGQTTFGPKDHGADRSSSDPAYVLTATGKQVPLPRLRPNDGFMAALGDRLLLGTSKAIDVVTKDGALAELVNESR